MIDRIVIINDLSNAKGGASQLALEAAAQFARRGKSVTLLCGSTGNRDLEAEGIEVVALGHGRLLEGSRAKAMVHGLYNRPAAAMVADWIARKDTARTVYHVHGWSQILSPALFSALRPVRERVLVHAHDFFFTCPNGAMFHFGRDAPCAATPMSAACLTSACDRRGTVSKAWRSARQGIQNRVLGATPPPLLLIHGGMAPYFARSGLSDGDMAVVPNPVVPWIPERIPAEENRSVLFVGRMEATKGIDLAAEACRRAGVRLTAIGDGEMLADLRHRYPEMAWIGRRKPSEVGQFARHARVAVMPSRHIEPFGLAAVEALWSGLPVITSRDALIAPDIVAAGAGLSVDPRDVSAFAAALSVIFADDARAREMSENAHRQTRSLAMPPEAWIDALLDGYTGLLDGGRAGLLAAIRRSVGDAPEVPSTAVVLPFRNHRAARAGV